MGLGYPQHISFLWVILLATNFMWYQWNGFLTGIFSDGDLFYLGDQFSASCFQPFATCNWCKSHQLLTWKSKSKAPARLQSMVSFVAFAGVLPPHSTWSGHWSNVRNSFETKKSFLGDWMMMWPPFAPNNAHRHTFFFACKLSMAKGATLRRTPVADMLCCTMASRWLKCSSVGSWPVHMRLSIHIQLPKNTSDSRISRLLSVSLAWMFCVVFLSWKKTWLSLLHRYHQYTVYLYKLLYIYIIFNQLGRKMWQIDTNSTTPPPWSRLSPSPRRVDGTRLLVEIRKARKARWTTSQIGRSLFFSKTPDTPTLDVFKGNFWGDMYDPNDPKKFASHPAAWKTQWP